MTAPPDEARRSLVGAFGWTLGAVGLGAIAYTLVQSAAAPLDSDPRRRVNLPDQAEGFFKVYAVLGRPIGVRGLSKQEAAAVNSAPGWPPFVVVDLVCTMAHQACVVAPEPAGAQQRAGWVCPCCGSRYTLLGKPSSGPAKQALAIPPHRFIDQHTLVIGGANAPA